MKIEQNIWDQDNGWSKPLANAEISDDAQLVLAFGASEVFKQKEILLDVRKAYPNACVFGCSTAGEILNTEVHDDSLVVTAIFFEHSAVECAKIEVEDSEKSETAGKQLADKLDRSNLVHVLLLSDGLHINGSALVKGLVSHLPKNVAVTGGLAGDGEDFQNTWVMLGNDISERTVVAVGLYGERLNVGYGSMGGWDSFGPERLITRSKGNVLYEMDGRSALDLYKKYLGDHAKELPASGLLFPLSIRLSRSGGEWIVRTIVSIDEEEGSLTFVGDIPEGAYARLMKANFDRLIDGAAGAAVTSYEAIGSTTPDLAILISCVGRKMVLKQRVEEEVENVQDALGEGAVLAGFYSYGEISPFTPNAKCELHNQTMTITTLSEK